MQQNDRSLAAGYGRLELVGERDEAVEPVRAALMEAGVALVLRAWPPARVLSFCCTPLSIW